MCPCCKDVMVEEEGADVFELEHHHDVEKGRKKKGKGGVGKESRWEEAVDAAHQAVASLSLQQAQEEHELSLCKV